MEYGIPLAKDGSIKANSLESGINRAGFYGQAECAPILEIRANRTVLICGLSTGRVEEMARRADSIQLPKELVADLLESSLRFQEVAETLEVQLDKKTVKRLKTGDKELKKRQYKVASSREDIDRILSS